MLYPYRKHVVVVWWFLILIVVQVSSALRGGPSSQNGIFSSNIGPNRTLATSRPFPFRNVFSALRKNQESLQQTGGSPTTLSLLARRRNESRTTALQVAEIPSDDKKDDDDVDVDWSKLGHDRLGKVLYGKFGASINSITGKKKNDPAYQFGDLTKWVDRQARTQVGGFWKTSSKNETALQTQGNVNNSMKQQQQQQQHKKPLIDLRPFQKLYTKFGEKANSVTGKKDPYEFGDLTRWLDTTVRSEVKEVESEVKGFYKIARKIRGDKRRHTITMEQGDGEDAQMSSFMSVAFGVFAFLRSITLVSSIRLVLKLGIERPVLRRLPTIILMEIVHLILDGDYRPLILRVVAMELDKRFKIAILGDEDYQFGDLTKKTLTKFTGKNEYEFGDITKRILQRAEVRKTSSSAYSEEATATYKDQNQKELQVLEEDVRSYQFGDLTKKAVTKFTGKDQYEFGDITKRILVQKQVSEEAKARYKDQVQEELDLEDDKSPPPSRQGSRIPTLRWFRK